MTLDQALQTATEVALESGDLLLSYFQTDRVGSRLKGTRDVVTEADLASERLVVQRLRQAFPDDGLVAEEGSEVASRSGRTWYIDPLDGTLNYSRGIPFWCVSIGMMEGGRPVLGVIHDPIRGETFTGAAGHGAWLGDRRLGCSSPPGLSDVVLHITVDFHDESQRQGIEDLVRLAPRVLRTRNLGSAALALAYVAAGRFDAMLHRFAHAWDYVAGVSLILEAGGHVTGVDGLEFTSQTNALAATATRQVHTSLLVTLQSD